MELGAQRVLPVAVGTRRAGRCGSRSAPTKTGPPPRRASVVAVCGPRGGVGATFVATHLAAAFARSGARTVLVDADWRFADLTVALGVPDDEPVRTVEDLVPVAGELEDRHLDEVLWRHPVGFDALLGAGAPRRRRRRSSRVPRGGRRRGRVAGRGRRPLRAGAPSDEAAGAVLPQADRILLVLALDVLSFRGGRRRGRGARRGGARVAHRDRRQPGGPGRAHAEGRRAGVRRRRRWP